eukprot:6124809-Pyramimonas_sp.AAC.1
MEPFARLDGLRIAQGMSDTMRVQQSTLMRDTQLICLSGLGFIVNVAHELLIDHSCEGMCVIGMHFLI